MGGGYTPIGSPNDVSMINSGQNASALNLLNGQIGQYGQQGQSALGQSQALAGQMSGLSDNYSNLINRMIGGAGQQGITGQIGQLAQGYDPNAGFQQFLSQQPALQATVGQMANSALSEYGQNSQELARATSQASLSDTAGQLASAGLLGAGAGTSAMTQAALLPELQAAQQLAQIRAGYMQNVGGQLTSQSMGQAQGAYDAQQQTQMQGLLAQLQGLSGAGGLLGNQIQGLGGAASIYGNAGNQYASLLGNASSAYAGMSQPEYWQPQYEKGTSASDWVSALAPIAGSVIGSLLLPGVGTAIGGGLGGGLAALLGGNSGAQSTADYTMNNPSYGTASQYSGYFNNPYFGN